MKNLFSCALTIAMFTFPLFSFAEALVVKGVYQGKDLYIKNAFAPDGVGFCIYEVLVNGEVTTDEINSSAFAIDLSLFGFEQGTALEVVLRSKENCDIKVINPEAIAPQSTFDVVSSRLEQNVLMWTTENEVGPIPFVIEQYKWNKWVEIGTVRGIGEKSTQEYRIEVPLHNGKNIFRVRQNDPMGVRYSTKMEFDSDLPEVTILTSKVSDMMRFSGVTQFEIFDAYGVLVGKGNGDYFNMNDLPAGRYYVNFDRHFGQTIVKK